MDLTTSTTLVTYFKSQNKLTHLSKHKWEETQSHTYRNNYSWYCTFWDLSATFPDWKQIHLRWRFLFLYLLASTAWLIRITRLVFRNSFYVNIATFSWLDNSRHCVMAPYGSEMLTQRSAPVSLSIVQLNLLVAIYITWWFFVVKIFGSVRIVIGRDGKITTPRINQHIEWLRWCSCIEKIEVF